MNTARLLVIAGSDSSGGAGIQADIKAAAALGGYAMTVITALTAQNTVGVTKLYPVPLSCVRAQFDTVVEDIGLDAVKVGMLHSADLVNLVAELLVNLKVPIVLDPVMIAKSGDRLLKKNAITILREKLLPCAYLVTPNLDETEALLDRTVRDLKAMSKAAVDLVALGASAVLVKGGHLVEKSADVLFDGTELSIFTSSRIDGPYTHGTGCTLATACATLLAQGWKLKPAVERARLLVRRAIIGGLALGRGCGPVHALADLNSRLDLGVCLHAVDTALATLATIPGLGCLLPEVRGQLGYALPGAISIDEVVAVSGRITDIDGYMRASGPPRLGSSSHIAKIIITAMAYDPTKRAAIVLRFNEALITRANILGWSVSEFNRSEEALENKIREGYSLIWGITQAINSLGRVPDLIFDRGELGKEPIIRLLARNPHELIRRVILLWDEQKRISL